jgi:hypothetical protein
MLITQLTKVYWLLAYFNAKRRLQTDYRSVYLFHVILRIQTYLFP